VEILRLFSTHDLVQNLQNAYNFSYVDPSFSNRSFPCYTMPTTIMVSAELPLGSKKYITDGDSKQSSIP